MYKRILTVVITAMIFLAGCSFDAERDNPLDPQSEHFSPGGKISGYITNLNETELPNVLVTVEPGLKGSITENNGYYCLSNLEDNTYTMTVTAEGFEQEQDTIIVTAGNSIMKNFALNALPQFSSFTVTSVHIFESSGGDDFFLLKLEALITDMDPNDLPDSAYYTYNSTIGTMFYQGSSSKYTRMLTFQKEDEDEISNLIGVSFVCSVSDEQGAQVYSGPTQLVRIINASFPTNLTTFSPNNYTYMSSQPTFQWAPPGNTGLFDYQYRMTVYRVEGDFQVYQKAFADSELIYELSDYTLSLGDHYWTIQLEDMFGNYSRSPKMYFVVQ